MLGSVTVREAIRRRPSASSIVFLAALAIAVMIGLVDGWQIRFIQSIPNLAALFAILVAMGTVVVVSVIVLIGLLALWKRGVASSLRVLAVAGALVGGALLGYATGRTWEYGTETTAQVEIVLDAPISRTYTAEGTCRTEDNGDRFVDIQTDAIIHVGADRMSVFIYPGRTVEGPTRLLFVGSRTQGRLADYVTGADTVINVALESRAMAGAGTFEGLEMQQRGQPLGGPDGPRRLDGRIAWQCAP